MQALKPFRDKIDAIDDQIVALMVKRFEVIRDVAAFKKQENIPAIIEDRIREVVDRAGGNAGAENEDMVRELYIMMVAISCDLEEQIIEGRPPLRDSEDVRDDEEEDDE
jgi:chorismate mutase